MRVEVQIVGPGVHACTVARGDVVGYGTHNGKAHPMMALGMGFEPRKHTFVSLIDGAVWHLNEGDMVRQALKASLQVAF